MMDFSILISTWNNCQRLAITLESLTLIPIPKQLKWEVIVVNNNCSDKTDEVIQKFMNRLPLVYVKEPLQGLSRARNKGLNAAKGRLIIFTDDDVRPFPEWVKTYWIQYQKHPEGYFFGGPIVSEFENPNFDRKILPFTHSSVRGLDWGAQEKVLGKDEYFIAANWACPREIIFQCGCFNINKGLGATGNKVNVGEESGLMCHLKQKGWKPLYLPQAKIFHFVPKQKCDLKHNANRAEALGLEHSWQYIENDRPTLIAGIPRWMYKRYFDLWKDWVFSKIRGNNGYVQYIEYRRMIGIMRGARALLRKRNAG